MINPADRRFIPRFGTLYAFVLSDRLRSAAS